ncbi:hypothetical protein [Vibrio sp. V15_P4S5T153]
MIKAIKRDVVYDIPPEPKNYKPKTNFFGCRIDLLTEDELIEIGFIVGNA